MAISGSHMTVRPNDTMQYHDSAFKPSAMAFGGVLGTHAISGPSKRSAAPVLRMATRSCHCCVFIEGQRIRRKKREFGPRRASGDSNSGHLVVATSAPPSAVPASPEKSGEVRGALDSAAAARAFDPQFESPGGREDEREKFVWRDHWYAVSLIEDLDPKIPTAFQLLGREIVLWRDAGGHWRAFEDKCPHRLAPLSEGRLDENGWLQCSYHGWSFKADGSCGRIPQAASEGPEARALKSPRACAVSFPTLVSQGLLFVWPDENGWEKASKFKPPMLPDAFSDPRFSTVTIQRDLFYGYDTLMENVSDPSHIDFAHHKVTGKRDRAKPLTFKVESNGPWGFSGSNSETPQISASFIAPCYYINKIEIPAKLPLVGEQTWEIWICSFNIPMAPGKTRSIVCSARNFFRFTMPGPAWWQLVPRWHEHWTSNKVYDGDMIVLQGQEKFFLANTSNGASGVNEQYTKLTFTPTQADRFVLAFRNWLRRHGNGQPEWLSSISSGQPLPSTVLSKRQMLDRYEQHTLKCSSCKKAYDSFQLLQKVLLGTTVVFAAGAGIPPEMKFRIVFASAAVLTAGLAFLLKEFEKNFVFVDYVHAEID